MKARLILPCVGLVLAGLLAGCAGQPATPLVIPSAAALPTVTPALTEPPTATLPPPTQTPVPTEALSCTVRIARITALAQELCGTTRTDEACLVSPGVTVELRAPQEAAPLQAAGDRAALTQLSRVSTGPYDAAASTWGMAVLRSSERPDATPFEATTLLLFGNASVLDVGSSMEGPFRNLRVLTGGADPWCTEGPLPGVLIQNGIGLADTLTINTVQVRFSGTLLVRTPTQRWMEIAVLNGQAEIVTPDGGIALQGGTQFFTLLGGESGYEPVGGPQVQILSAANREDLPLEALPRVMPVSVAAMPTADTLNYTPVPSPTFNLPPTLTPTVTVTPVEPFAGQTPPGGVYLTFEGKRIESGDRLNSSVPAGGSDSWVFTPRGYGPDSADSFEVQAVGDWDPVIIIESATFGIYEPEYDRIPGPLELYRSSLAGSGGDWRITIRDVDRRGGAYTIRYECLGPCQPPEG